MKRLLLPLLAVALATSLTSSAQETVTSVNAVGMVKVIIQPNNMAFLQFPFTNTNDQISVNTDLNFLPASSLLYIWDETTQDYVTVSKHPVLGWLPSGKVIKRGTGFFVVPAGTNPVEIIFSGEVPGTVTGGKIITFKPGLNAFGFPFPVEVTVEQSGIGSLMNAGETLYIWDNSIRDYKTVTKHPVLGMVPANTTIPVGAAVFYNNTTMSNKNYSAVPTYTWPNN